jgi:hypothetical protein
MIINCTHTLHPLVRTHSTEWNIMSLSWKWTCMYCVGDNDETSWSNYLNNGVPKFWIYWRLTLWVSVARQYTKKSYTDLTPDLREKWWWKYMPLKLFSIPTSPFRVTKSSNFKGETKHYAVKFKVVLACYARLRELTPGLLL